MRFNGVKQERKSLKLAIGMWPLILVFQVLSSVIALDYADFLALGGAVGGETGTWEARVWCWWPGPRFFGMAAGG